jgi:glycosyl hydrolase family 123
MARRKASGSGPAVEVYSEWVRIDPVSGRLIDKSALADPSAARLEDGDGCVHLCAAKNEYVSLQVIVRSSSRIRDIRIGFSGLTGPRGRKIGKAEFEPHVQWYHDMGKAAGWVPDALVPVNRLDAPVGIPWKMAGVPKQTAQGFWVDLFVPKDALKGAYAGHLTVTCDGSRHEVPLLLDVWPFAIPDKCSQVADMNSYAPGVAAGWDDLSDGNFGIDTPAYLEAEKNAFRCTHDHRSLLHYLPYSHAGHVRQPSLAPELTGKGKTIRVKSWAKFDRHMSGYYDGSAFKGTRRGPIPLPYCYTPQNFQWPADFVNYGRKGYATEWRRIGREFVEHFKKKGWTQTKHELFFNHKQRYKFYPYDGDEIRFLEDTEHMYHYRDLSEGVYDKSGKVQFIWRVDSSWVFAQHGKTDLTDFVKLWVVNGSCMAEAPENVDPMHEKGCELFHYGGGSSLDTPLSWVWMWPVRTLAMDVDGFTWWQTLGWNPDIWRTSKNGYATTVFFPGTPWGSREVVGGIRAKVLRNAMQTMEYAYRIDAKQRPGAGIGIINKVLGTDVDFWWNAGRPPSSGSDAADLDRRKLADPLSWHTVRAALAQAVLKA